MTPKQLSNEYTRIDTLLWKSIARNWDRLRTNGQLTPAQEAAHTRLLNRHKIAWEAYQATKHI